MKKDIINFIIKDKKVDKLLKEFINEFNNEYSCLNKRNKKIMLSIKDDLYRNWLYSAMLTDTYISPNYLINNIAQDKYPGQYVVVPKLSIDKIERDKVQFKKEILFYSMDEHPIIEDLEKLVQYSSPSLLLSTKETIIYTENEIINNITFNSPYYLQYLIEIAIKLGIIKEIKAINCKCFQKDDYFEEYNKLNNREKISLIYGASIDYAKENMTTMPNLQVTLDTSYIDAFLDNNIDDEVYLKFIKEAVPFADEFVKNIQEYTEDKKILETVRFAELIMGDEVGTFIMGTEIRSYLDIFFVNVFAYYLAIIQPTYVGPFILKDTLLRVLEAEEEFERTSALFNIEMGHDLSVLGENLLASENKKIREKGYKKFSSRDFSSTFNLAISEKSQIVKEFNLYRDVYGKDRDGGIVHELMNVVTGKDEKFNSYIIIQKHLDDFVQYLFENRGLKESTVINHARNMELFLGEFLMYSNEEDLKKINNNLIENYLGDWYIRTAATSITSIKDQIRSLKQYSAFLCQKGFITKEEMIKIKKVMENKEKYIEKYLQYIG